MTSIDWEKIEKDIINFGADIYPFEGCIRGEYVGEGAAMEVYEGECKIDMISKRVAFKYHKGFKRSSKLKQSKINDILDDFRHEIKLTRILKSDVNVVKIYGVTFIERKPVLIVELGDETLDKYLQERFESENPASWVEKIKLCLDVLRGIRGLHDVGIIHGDIKGENILVFIESTGIVTAKISDFGYSSTLTSSKKNVGGTMWFMAPEAMGIYPELTQWQKKPVNDIFSFGLLTYQAATNGSIPYEDSDDVILARTTDRDMKILLSELPDGTPEQFRTIIINTTKFMPTDRASIDDVEKIITDFLDNPPPQETAGIANRISTINITSKTVIPPPTVAANISGMNWDRLEKSIVGFGPDIYPFEECILGDRIGAGTTMEVQEGQCIIDNASRRVAFKFHKGFKKTRWRQNEVKDIIRNFRHEITSMKKTKNHPNIIQLYGITFRERKPILIVELGQETLEEYLGRSPANWIEKIRLCLDVLRGIQGLHDAGIIHGDIKGSDILIVHSAGLTTAKISDFGNSVTLSSNEGVFGTQRYMAPETMRMYYSELVPWSKKPTIDIFKFGLVTYQIAADGKIPYEDYDDDNVLGARALDRDMKNLLSGLPNETPKEFRTIIVNTTKLRPTDRASLDTVEQIIKDFLANKGLSE